MMALIASAIGLASCKDKPKGDAADADLAASAPPAQKGEDATAALDLIDDLGRCEVDHGGALIDLGSAAAHGITGSWTLAPDAALVESERDGETWVKVMSRNVSMRFVLDEPTAAFVSMRARGGLSRSVSVAIDGKPLGVLPLIRGQARVVSTRASAAPLAAGPHTVEVRFSAAGRGQADPLAEVDWVRVGTSDDESRTYVPPTMKQIMTNASLGAVPHRSIAARAPSTVRCSTFVAPGARLKVAMGFEGQGEGDGDLRVVREGEPAVLLRAEHVKGGDRAEWTPVDVPLDAFAGRVVTLELRSKSSTAGGRLLFGDPTLYVPSKTGPAPPARLAVVVVMAGLDRSKLANRQAYPAFAELERSATSFDAHRSPTTVSAGVMASILTGFMPRAHGLEDSGARLPGAVTTLGVAARDGSVQTAMFSGCPTTFEAFGFSRGWDKYATYSPVEGAPAVAPLTEATRWTVDHMKSADARALVIVHARGGHPPWDVTINESAKLPPSEYSGPMEARRAGELIARARARHSRFRLSENDRTRMWAIYDAALAGQDRALGQFVEALRKANLWDETLFVVTGDVSTASDSRAPFGDGEDLAEPLLRVPLWIHFPGGALSGKRVASPTEVTDVARSVLGSLHLPTPDGFEGLDLFATAMGSALPAGRPALATLGPRYALRLGDLTLTGSAGKQPALCELSSDPNCEVDRFERMPRAGAFLFRLAFEAEAAAQKRRLPREPATVDANTAAALQVWGE
jgi:hypothetical protein